MCPNESHVEPPADREVVIVRTFDAPARLLLEASSKRERDQLAALVTHAKG